MTSILEAGLWPRIFDRADEANKQFWADPRHCGRFANLSLLYDTLVFPSSDFGIVPALLRWLGLRSFREALETEALRFVRYHGCLAYVGNGGGVNSFIVQATGERRFQWWQAAMFGDRYDAIDLQLRHGSGPVPDFERKSLADAIFAASQDFQLQNEAFIQQVAHGAYQPLRNST